MQPSLRRRPRALAVTSLGSLPAGWAAGGEPGVQPVRMEPCGARALPSHTWANKTESLVREFGAAGIL